MDPTSLLFIPLAVLVAALTVRGLDALDRKYALQALGAHFLASIAQWGLSVTVYQGMDSFGYQKVGEALARLLSLDFLEFAPEVMKHVLQMEANLPVPYTLTWGSTGSLEGISGFLAFFTGSSLLSLCFAASLIAWMGQTCVYRVAREELPDDDRGALATGFLFVPSTLFWCSGITKEAVAVGFFGIVFVASYRVLKQRAWSQLIPAAFAAVGVAVLKPYILLGFVVALGAAIYSDRAWRAQGGPIRIRPFYLVLAAGVAVGGVLLMGRLFPELAAQKMATTLAERQQAWRDYSAEGDSGLALGGGDAGSITQQLVLVPLAIVNVLFRPFLFEVRNGPMLLASVESTLIVIGFSSLVLGGNARLAVQSVLRQPMLLFSVVFTIVFGTGVGLATSNLGSVSRYRVPMMPFYVGTLLVLRARFKQVAPARIRAPVRRSRMA
jgi:hypothetical protein